MKSNIHKKETYEDKFASFGAISREVLKMVITKKNKKILYIDIDNIGK